MAFVRVEQRNARLAAAVRLTTVEGRDGPFSKGLVTAISNVRKGSGDAREDEATSIQCTLWGKLAENAAQYLSKGSRVNVVGRVQNNTYQSADGQTVYALAFTCEEIDYLDSRLEAEARRAKEQGALMSDVALSSPAPVEPSVRSKAAGKSAESRRAAKAPPAADDDVPF